jgi:cytidine deaminase
MAPFPAGTITAMYSSGMTNDELIRIAERVLNPKRIGDRLFGDVASTLITDKGNQYSGVCIDTGSGTGFCAEHSAIAAMVTAREYKIKKIVAVWKDANGKLFVVPPCGRCREFIRQIDEDNLDADVVLGPNKVVKLRDLLPYHEWPEPVSTKG